MTQKGTSSDGSDVQEKFWFLNSGFSNHTVGNKDLIFDFDGQFYEFIKLGYDSNMAVMGKGSFKLHIRLIVQVMTEVYYIIDLRNNLLSVGHLQQKNRTIIFTKILVKCFSRKEGSSCPLKCPRT